MPLPDLPEHNTDRIWFHYNDGFYDHSLQFRHDNDSVPEGDVLLVIHEYLVALSSALYAINFVRAEIALKSSNVRNPVSWPHDLTYGLSAMPEVNAPRYFMLTGRDRLGYRWHLTQFGANFSTPASYKIVPGTVGFLDDARAVLNAAFFNNTIVSISHQKVVTNAVVPVGFNDHFIAEQRG